MDPDTSPNYPVDQPPARVDKGKNPGLFVMLAGFLIAIAPVLLAPILVIGCEEVNEASCPGAAAPWLLFFSVPFGGLILLIGIILAISHAAKSPSQE